MTTMSHPLLRRRPARTVLRGVALALVVSGGLAAAAWTAPSAVAADETCQGETATVVGGTDKSQRVRGTDGPDVIVTAGAQVWAGDGDDLICVTAAATDGFRILVGAGAGDDQVFADTSGDPVAAHLGAGSDSVLGTDGVDVIDTDTDAIEFEGEDGFGTPAADGDRDVVDAAGGDDFLRVAKPGTLTDDLDLGAGGGAADIRADVLDVQTPVVGGTAQLTLRLAKRPYVINDALDLVTHLDERFAWTGFSDLVFIGGQGNTYRGSAGDDRATVGSVATANAGGGDDRFSFITLASPTAAITGGTGTDVLSSSEDRVIQGVRLDTAARTLTVGGVVKSLAGWESYDLRTLGRLTMLGSAGADRFAGAGCELEIRGGAGDDRIVAAIPNLTDLSCTIPLRVGVVYGGTGTDRISSPVNARQEIHGGPDRDYVSAGGGADTVYGDGGNDVLDGGAGTWRDTVYGGTGIDTCRGAEVKRGCER